MTQETLYLREVIAGRTTSEKAHLIHFLNYRASLTRTDLSFFLDDKNLDLTSAASGKDSDWDEKGVQRQSTTNAMKTPKRGLQRSDKAVITCRLPLWYRGVEHTF